MSDADLQRDLAVAGRSLERAEKTRHAAAGAHDPTATPYSVLEGLLGGLDLGADSHLLDVGCGAGRVLAYFVDAALPGRVTGVELDPALAEEAAAWSARYPNVRVVEGSVLLTAFLDRLEREAVGSVTLVHMSDNGEWPAYVGRPRWTLLREGAFELPGGEGDCPQHFSIRRLDFT